MGQQALSRVAVVETIVPQSSRHFLLLTQVQRAVGHLSTWSKPRMPKVSHDSWWQVCSWACISCLSPLLLQKCMLTRGGFGIKCYDTVLWPERNAYAWKTLPPIGPHKRISTLEELDLDTFMPKETRVVPQHSRCCMLMYTLLIFGGLPQFFLARPNACLRIGFQKH